MGHYVEMYPVFFFFNDTATNEIYTLSLHDALPIDRPRAHPGQRVVQDQLPPERAVGEVRGELPVDRKSTRLNSSHRTISYAVFCEKKKKEIYGRDANRHRRIREGEFR